MPNTQWYIATIIVTLIFNTILTDVDECASDPCGEGGFCENTEGSYSCECRLGYNKEPGEDHCTGELRKRWAGMDLQQVGRTGLLGDYDNFLDWFMSYSFSSLLVCTFTVLAHCNVISGKRFVICQEKPPADNLSFIFPPAGGCSWWVP